jgi:hypothetical protein
MIRTDVPDLALFRYLIYPEHIFIAITKDSFFEKELNDGNKCDLDISSGIAFNVNRSLYLEDVEILKSTQELQRFLQSNQKIIV